MNPEPEICTVNANGLAFRVRIEGPEGAPWLAFSNSLLTNLHMWDAVVAPLRSRYRILRYDQRGHGGSQVPDAAATIRQLGEDLAALLALFDVSEAVLVGISMGFGTVLAAADAAPQRMRGLVLADGAATAPASTAAVWEERIELTARHGMDALVAPTVERWFMPGFVSRNGPELEAVREMIRCTPHAGYAACARALAGYDVRAAMAAVTVPVLLVSGSGDGPLPQVLAELAYDRPGTRYAEIADAGHLPAIEQPERFSAALEGFLAELR